MSAKKQITRKKRQLTHSKCQEYKNYFEADVSMSLRASLAGIPSWWRACSQALLVPASGSILRAISRNDISSGNLRKYSITILSAARSEVIRLYPKNAMSTQSILPGAFDRTGQWLRSCLTKTIRPARKDAAAVAPERRSNFHKSAPHW
jgi:hypothetical protein